MSLKRQLFFLLISCGLCGNLAQAYEYGPPAGYTAAPGDNKTACIASGCHVGTVNSNTAGSVKILLPGGASTYVPGQAMTIQVQITDSSKRSYGFQLTARLVSSTSTQAGSFTAGSDGYTQVLCADSSVYTGNPCPKLFPVQDIEHTSSGWSASISSKGSFTYSFTWTPPAAGAGNVIMYVAGNAGTGGPSVTPTDVYTSNVTLTPASSSPTPSISGISNGASFNNTLAPNTYVAIFGSNLSTVASFDSWSNSFTKNANGTLSMPTNLDGTTVTVNGTPAYVQFVDAGQVNIVTPNITATGSGVPVIVSVNGTPSATFSITLQSVAPSFFTWQPATADYGKYLVAQHQATNLNVGKVGLFPTAAPNFTTPAKPGELIVLYGTGFGPTSPPIPNGIETDPTGATLYQLSPTPTVTLGGVNCQVVFAGLGPALSQVYQFDVYVPASLTAGDYPLIATVNGIQSVSGLITVQP